jgi:hypothetical protein
MSGDLDSILNDDEQPAAAVEPAAEPEAPAEPEVTPEPVAEEAKAPVRDEKGRFAPKGETTGESPTPEKAEPPLDHAAVLGERRRRQESEARNRELEARIAQYEARMASPQQYAPQVQQQPASFEFNEDLYWSNPQQFLQSFKQSILQEVQGIVPQIVTGTTLDRSEQLARARYEDYDQAFAAFRDVASVNPMIREKLAQQVDPAEFAYQEGKRLLEMSNFGSANEYIEAEVARRLAEASQPQAVEKPAPIIPESLADAPAAGASGFVPQAPLSLDAVLGRKG